MDNILYKVRGHVDYRIISKKYGVIEHVTQHNTVVKGVKNVITRLMGHGTDQISVFGVGTSTTTPNENNTALTNAVLTLLVSYDITATNAVTFSYWVDYELANDIIIGEIGLLTTSGVLVARTTRSPFQKTSDMAIDGRWTLEYP